MTVDEHNLLSDQYAKIDFVREDSVLAAFLSKRFACPPNVKDHPLFFPFGFNLSQKKAVENALSYQISIIEGPPGTGKTQTILNIIANAVVAGESVAVVSSNNSATSNVLEKLKKYGVDFIAAPLGNASNRSAFIESQNCNLPDMSSWETDRAELQKIYYAESELDEKLAEQNELSALTAEWSALSLERSHFEDYYNGLCVQGDLPSFSKRSNANKILNFAAEYEFYVKNQKEPNFIKKLVWKIRYGIENFRFWRNGTEQNTAHLRKLYYDRKIAELKTRIEALKNDLSSFCFEEKMKQYTALSLKVFKAGLKRRYGAHPIRNYYQAADLRSKSEKFIKDYPVVLSTTYSLRMSLSTKFIYDYVIVDEASQVDLVTAALALSCAKKVVVVGDLKQLPNVVTQEQKVITDRIFASFSLNEAYRFSSQSLLSAAVSLFPDAPRVMLREHYRCHPEIIGFCNQRFYDNKLIVLTESQTERPPLMVYRTVQGNHARNHMNQRQIDVILNEVIPEQHLNLYDNSVGIVTPYRNQANALQSVFSHTSVKADTADKFQGQERKTIIFSTVDNEIGDFVSDPNRLNVAVSRAMDQFIVVTDGNHNDMESPIHELIEYIQYHNHEIIQSNVRSVFDNLYRDYAASRTEILRKYGRVADVDSENLMYALIKDVLAMNRFTTYDVVMHVPLYMIFRKTDCLNERETAFVSNALSHVDFLIFSKVTHRPALAVEVDGYRYHSVEKQMERDNVKDSIFHNYDITLLRMNTTGSGEKEKLLAALSEIASEKAK